MAHYDMPTRLPSLAPYLRVKYGELPEEALDRCDRGRWGRTVDRLAHLSPRVDPQDSPTT